MNIEEEIKEEFKGNDDENIYYEQITVKITRKQKKMD